MILGVVTLLCVGCAPAPDLEAERQALMDADRAFAAATAERGVEGWVSYFADDGVQYPKQGVVIGKEAIRALMAPGLSNPSTVFTWKPESAVVSASGDLGYTRGRWEVGSRDEAGEVAIGARGNYVSIWRKGPDGAWKVAVDIGNDDPPPPPADEAAGD
jgi:ketosteroid isomerase-like protein